MLNTASVTVFLYILQCRYEWSAQTTVLVSLLPLPYALRAFYVGSHSLWPRLPFNTHFITDNLRLKNLVHI